MKEKGSLVRSITSHTLKDLSDRGVRYISNQWLGSNYCVVKSQINGWDQTSMQFKCVNKVKGKTRIKCHLNNIILYVKLTYLA